MPESDRVRDVSSPPKFRESGDNDGLEKVSKPIIMAAILQLISLLLLLLGMKELGRCKKYLSKDKKTFYK